MRNAMDRSDLAHFNRDQPFSIINRVTPHWVQSGCLVFVTWRTKDSLPASAIRQIELEMTQHRKHSNDAEDLGVKEEADLFGMSCRQFLSWNAFHLYEKYVDAGHGACLLKIPRLRSIVFDSILKFDRDRYYVTDLVIMPNHLHLLVAYPDEVGLLRQSEDWKRYTARRINQEVGRRGDFWMPGQFDHLVRSEKQFDFLREYIANNPRLANLKSDEFTHYSK
jgi:putative transposase